jgi:hypothetical protein
MDNAHNKTAEDVLSFFKVDPKQGLTPKLIEEYRAKYGRNGTPAR